MSSYSVVEYFAEHEGYRCGYCGSKDSNYSHGMWAHQLTCQDYQDLIDRGWRRSGKYVYKPTMDKMCCPSYTIKCEALNFKLSKSQKKLLKKVTKYLTVKDSEIEKTSQADDEVEGHTRPARDEAGASHGRQEGEKQKEGKNATSGKTTTPGAGADPSKPKCKKAKLVRMEKKMKKLETQSEAQAVDGSKSKQQNAEKSLEDLLQHVEPGSNPVHNLEIKLVRSTPKSQQFKETFKESAKLFAKYQMAIHKDPPEECTVDQYTRFLVDSPLEEENSDDGPDCGYGSFHQQYWLDGKLIAVGVVDILPNCLSSVYLFYDPDYNFLSPGTYSALQEIGFTRELHQSAPALQYYYMGFYIHSCPKMKYKGNYHPSYLLCPEAYTWVPIDKCQPKLDASNYARLEETDKADEPVDINEIMVLHQRQAMPYMIYKVLSKSRSDTEEVKEYAQFVGKKCGRSLLLYRA
ncbi:arginyl-tRNA--protein transferase 1-like isoform X2 [Ptychodera flava]|uniref:arginyl-tRNA--protein transferase 1-like isoform X2 n=1 Tax=Ptychodera flava TaxID=63121 RepID=UPI003969FDC4